MENYSDMTVTVKLKSYELQQICEIYKELNSNEIKPNVKIEIKDDDRQFISGILNRMIQSGRRKAEKLESIGTEFRNSINFAFYK